MKSVLALIFSSEISGTLNKRQAFKFTVSAKKLQHVNQRFSELSRMCA
jgi:hypothetical protein